MPRSLRQTKYAKYCLATRLTARNVGYEMAYTVSGRALKN